MCLAAACFWPARDARAQLRFDTWTIEDGLPQNSINDIVQTPDGYVWLATYGGLVRFDGMRFTVFDRSVDGVGSLRTRALLVDRAGTLWAGTDDGMLIQYRGGSFKTFSRSEGLSPGVALRIDEGRKGEIWITWLDRLTKFDGQAFSDYRPEDLAYNVRPHPIAAHAMSAFALWWSQDAEGVHCFVRGAVDLCLPARALPQDEVVDVSSDQDVGIWILTRRGGVAHVVDGHVRRYGSTDGLPAALPAGTHFHRDRQGKVWLTAPPGHLYLAGQLARGPLLTTAFVVFEDRERSLWVGSTTGLYRVVNQVISLRTVRDGLSSNNTYAVLRDRRGDVWIGTWGDGVTRLSGGRAATVGRDQGLPSGLITSLYEDASGRLLIGTAAGLTYLAGNRVVAYPDPNGWLAAQVWAIHEDAAGTFWFGTEAGLVVEREGRFRRYTTADGLTHDGVTALYEDGSHTLWIGTARGLTRFRDGVFSSYTDREGFVGNHVRAFHEDDQGVLWVGTYDGGLYRIADEGLTRYTTKVGLHDNGVFQILDDGRGFFWLSSNRGIYRVSRDDLNAFARGERASVRSTSFGIRDGMSTLECNGGRQPAGARMPDGTLWFPTQGGIAVVDPGIVEPSRQPPPAIIEEVRLRGESVAFDDGVDVPADRNSLEVRFTATTFLKPEQTRFRYRLAGLDDGWIEAGTERSATYYRIQPGSYRFEVTAATSDGTWNDVAAVVAVVVHAPFWRQGWFLAATAVMVGALIGAAVRQRIAVLERHHAQQRAFARRLLETQEQERRRISNELHDSLGQDLHIIKAHARTARETTADASVREALDTIETLAGRSYQDMKHIAHALRPYQLDKIGLTRTIEGMLNRVRQSCGLALETDIEDTDDLFAPDEAISVYRIVQEAVNNVVRHSGAARAQVHLRRRPRAVEVRVDDDGCGFRSSSPPAGLGLLTMQERAASLGGALTVRSAPGQGTTVTVTVPASEAPHD